MAKKRRTYPPQFKAEVVKLVSEQGGGEQQGPGAHDAPPSRWWPGALRML
jgi:transposase-like protein